MEPHFLHLHGQNQSFERNPEPELFTINAEVPNETNELLRMCIDEPSPFDSDQNIAGKCYLETRRDS